MLVTLLAFPALSAETLPVRRVRFYETGVGWFEREGVVRDSASLPVPTSHLDDALKTLVVLGGDAQLGAITFPSASGDDAARVAAGLSGAESVGFEQALRALKGARVTLVTASAELSGVLLEIEGPLEVPPAPDGTIAKATPAMYALTVFGDDGSLHRTSTDGLKAVRSDDPEVSARLATAARALTPTAASRPNALAVDVGAGGRVGIGYLAETPVWRVSYRLLAREGDVELQAWGLVHNDTDEDWSQVAVELANGEPDSFLYPLAAPRYAERALVTPERPLSTVAQLAATTADALWTAALGGSMGMGGLGSFGSGMGGGASAMGVGGVSVIGVAARLKEAEPVQTPTQFVYRVARPVDLPAHHSALVPLVHGDVPAERAVTFAPGATTGRSAMWLVNGTGRTLPAGVVSVLEAGGLAGETALERLKPGETQMLTFGNELDVDLTWTVEATEPSPTALRVAQGRLGVTEEASRQTTYAVSNRSGRERALWVALELPPEADVTDGVRAVIDPHTGWTWAVLDVGTGNSAPVVRSATRAERWLSPEEVTPSTWTRWAELELADPAVLTRAATLRASIDRAQAEQQALAADHSRAQTELAGLRESLRAAEGSDGTSALARRAASVEAEIRRLDERLRDAQAQHDAQIRALRELVRSLEPDATADLSAP